jgi:hypothetical protein
MSNFFGNYKAPTPNSTTINFKTESLQEKREKHMTEIRRAQRAEIISAKREQPQIFEAQDFDSTESQDNFAHLQDYGQKEALIGLIKDCYKLQIHRDRFDEILVLLKKGDV